MLFLVENIGLDTTKPIELIDITSHVSDFCCRSEIKNGLVVVTSLHTTAAVSINEKCDRLQKDFVRFAAGLADPKAAYVHNAKPLDDRPNAHSHLLKFLMSTSETIVVEKGRLNLGPWQSIFFVELDGPRKSRQVQVTLIGV